MSKTKKPRKAYRPKEVVRNPVEYFVGGLKRYDADHMRAERIKNSRALADLVTGHGNTASWDRIVGAINMGNVLCELGTGDEYRDVMLSARDVMMDIRERYFKIGKFVLKGDELVVLNMAMDVHDAQLDASRIIDVERAADEVVRRVRSGINVERAA